MLSLERINVWMLVYEDKLFQAVRTRPDQYTYPVSEVPAVAARMREAMIRGTFNKDGLAMRWTCAHFGIRPTYKAISEFLKGGTCVAAS